MPNKVPAADLHLLLEDYPKRIARGVAGSAPARPNSSNPASASPRADEVEIDLLIDHYPARTKRWLRRFEALPVRQPAGRGVELPAADGQPAGASGSELHLLLEEYDPGSRFQTLRRLRDGRDGTGQPRADTGPRPAEGVAEAPAASRSVAGAAPDEPALDLLPWPDETLLWTRENRVRAASFGIHAVVVLVLALLPQFRSPRLVEPGEYLDRETISLLAPPQRLLSELTQRAPNQGKVTPQFRGLPEPPRPVIVAPPIPPEPRPPVLAPQPAPPEPEVKPVPAAPSPEADKPEPEPGKPRRAPAAAQSPEKGDPRPGSGRVKLGPNELPAPRRPSQPPEQPALTLENPTATSPGREGPLQLGSLTLSARPDQMIEAAVEQLAKQGGGKQSVGDGSGPGGADAYLPPSPGNAGSNLELLSDPRGVDFRPYLMQVLAAVRRNWYAVIPESARLGVTRGRVAIQFAISRDGNVPKLVIASSSGVQPLDRAAVAGISASHPFPRLPAEFSGNEVRLQFVFLYNIKTQ